LRESGNDRVAHLVSEGMPHGYYFFPGLFREGDEAFAAIARFLRAGSSSLSDLVGREQFVEDGRR
jgi:acetyl esterase/lipase